MGYGKCGMFLDKKFRGSDVAYDNPTALSLSSVWHHYISEDLLGGIAILVLDICDRACENRAYLHTYFASYFKFNLLLLYTY